MEIFNIYFHGRRHGAIGRFFNMVVTVEAKDAMKALNKFWKDYPFEVHFVHKVKRVENNC